MVFYLVTSTGETPDSSFIKEILMAIPIQGTHGYRCGPSINDPMSVIEDLSKRNEGEWSFLFLYEDNSFVIFTEDENNSILKDLKDPEWEGHLTGEIVEAFIDSNRKEE